MLLLAYASLRVHFWRHYHNRSILDYYNNSNESNNIGNDDNSNDNLYW